MSRILAYVPHTRVIQPSVDSILSLDFGDHEVVIVLDRMDDPQASAWDNVTRKYQRAREMALMQGYDALLTLEDDLIIPSDALHRLIACEADIAYGLTVWRHAPHRWSAAVSIKGDGHHITVDMAGKSQEAWGQVIDCVGCGLFCTLIRRNVLEALPFHRRGIHCCDWYLAEDAEEAGFSQRCDTRLLCGHINGERVFWPTEEGFRCQTLA